MELTVNHVVYNVSENDNKWIVRQKLGKVELQFDVSKSECKTVDDLKVCLEGMSDE